LPCWLIFDQQDEAYRLSVLRSGAPILSLEALSVIFHCNLTTTLDFLTKVL
jgi:transketolase